MAYRIIAYIELAVIFIVGISIFSDVSDYSYKAAFEQFLMAILWIILGFAFVYIVALGVKVEKGEPIPKWITVLSVCILIGFIAAVLIAIIAFIVWLASFGVAGFMVGAFLFIMVCLYSILLFGK